jgi:hypothetical protein
MTAALKFLRPGRVGPFTEVEWPSPGVWLESNGEPELCKSGIHALRPSALPMWLAEELWHVELDDVRETRSGFVLARRARLLDRVSAWNDETAREFARACLAALPRGDGNEIVRQRCADAVKAAQEVSAGSSAAAVGYITAKAAEADRPGGYDEERARQAAWLEERLGLSGSASRTGGSPWWGRFRRRGKRTSSHRRGNV